MKTLEKITNINFDHKLWFNEIRYYIEEIPIYRSWIAELADEAGSKEKKILKQYATAFKNQEKELKNILRHIKKHEMHIYHLTHMNGSLEHISNKEHEDIRDQIIAIRVRNEILKKEFMAFINS